MGERRMTCKPYTGAVNFRFREAKRLNNCGDISISANLHT